MAKACVRLVSPITENRTVLPQQTRISGAELLFEVFSQRYERGSTIVAFGLAVRRIDQPLFSSERLTDARLNRLTHHVHILEMNGDSYRLNQSKRRSHPCHPRYRSG